MRRINVDYEMVLMLVSAFLYDNLDQSGACVDQDADGNGEDENDDIISACIRSSFPPSKIYHILADWIYMEQRGLKKSEATNIGRIVDIQA